MSQRRYSSADLTCNTRTRTGCVNCRRRKKKCDELKPICSSCRRIGLSCEFNQPGIEFVNATPSAPNCSRYRRKPTRKGHQTPITSALRVDDFDTPMTSEQSPPLALHSDAGSYNVIQQNVPGALRNDNISPDENFEVSNLNHNQEYHQGGRNSIDQLVDGPQIPHHLLFPYPRTSSRLNISSGSNQRDVQLSADETRSSERQVDYTEVRVYPKTSLSPSTSIMSSGSTSSLVEASLIGIENSSLKLNAWFSSFVDRETDLPVIGSPYIENPDTLEIDPEFYSLQEKLYLEYWTNYLSKEFPTTFEVLDSLSDDCSCLQPAIIALSACDLAHTRTETRSRMTKSGKQWFYGPSTKHLQYGRLYYNNAIGQLARLNPEHQSTMSVFATLFLFVHIELLLGSFRGAAMHHHGIEHLMSENYGSYAMSAHGRSLISAWVASRARNWSFRIPYTVLDFQKSLIDLNVDIEEILDPSESPSEALTVILLESWRLSLMLLFERYTGRGDMESISSRCCRDFHQHFLQSVQSEPWKPKISVPDENYGMLLVEQTVKLAEWYRKLPLSHHPVERVGGLRDLMDYRSLFTMDSCLKFQNHKAAMEYLYYVAARILSSKISIDEFLLAPSQDSQPHSYPSEIDYWFSILLKTIAGLDIQQCARYNTYSVGILQILTMCHLRLPRYSTMIVRFSDYVVEKLTKHCFIYEGATLVAAFQQNMKKVEEQRSQGKDLFYVMPPGSPDMENLPYYVEDYHTICIGYGRDRMTDSLFCAKLTSGKEI